MGKHVHISALSLGVAFIGAVLLGQTGWVLGARAIAAYGVKSSRPWLTNLGTAMAAQSALAAPSRAA